MATNNFQDGVLCVLHVGRWSGAKKLEPSDLGLSAQEIPDFMRLGKKLLIPKEERNQFVQIEQNSRNALDRESFPFPVGGARFIPRNRLLKADAELANYRTEYERATESFMERYEEIRDKMLETYPEHRDKLEPYYPASHWVRRSFSFSWNVFEIGVMGIREGETAEAYERFRNDLQTQFDKFLEEVVIDLRYQVQETCGKLAKRVETGEIVTEQNIKAIKNVIQKFDNLNFVGDVKIENQLSALRSQLNGTSAKDLKDNESLNASLGAIAADIAKAAADISDLSEITGGYKRRLEI